MSCLPGSIKGMNVLGCQREWVVAVVNMQGGFSLSTNHAYILTKITEK